MSDDLLKEVRKMWLDMNEDMFIMHPNFESGFLKYYRAICEFNKMHYDDALNKKEKGEELTVLNQCALIQPLICGALGNEMDLDKALEKTNTLLKYVFDKKPKEEFGKENKTENDKQVNHSPFISELLEEGDFLMNRFVLRSWLIEYSMVQYLLGDIYACKEEYVKSAYHYMLAVKGGWLENDEIYVSFIDFVIKKLPQYVSGKAEYTGCGFSAEDPMGSIYGSTLIPQWAPLLISAMEGENGEVVVLKKTKDWTLGFLERAAAILTKKETNARNMIDMYRTYIIDKDFNVKKINLYFNGYFKPGLTEVRCANGFRFNRFCELFRKPNHVGFGII